MRAGGSASNHRFGRFLLQPGERRLLADGVEVSLGPRAFDLLVELVENGGHLASKDALLDLVWPHAVVEENALQAQVSALRKVLGKEAIATVSGRGYRFTLAVASTPIAEADAGGPPHNLSMPLTSFIGREKELVELSQLMRQARLLTLTGAGGCGKTRLALQLAAGVRSMFPDGVWWVELAALSNPALVPQALGGLLLPHGSSATPILDRIADHLGARRTLLVLDNAEHLLDACARLIDELLKRCAHTSVMVTSRERLAIDGELTFRVPSLSVPHQDSDSTLAKVLQFEAVRLFVERARMHRPDFAATEQNAGALASLSRRLDGIPLAIELAAARLRVMSPEEIERRLDQRFSLLTDGFRTALPRHRTLQSLVDWSHDLLDVDEKALLRRAAVFTGGWTLDAAEKICAMGVDEERALLDRLTSLVDKSLIQADERNGVTRYQLLETMREYGGERLREHNEETLSRDRHLAYFVGLAEEAEPHLDSAAPAAWLDRLEVEHDNLRAAMAWATRGGHPSQGMRLAAGIWRFWWLRGYVGEGRDLLTPLLGPSAAHVDPALRGSALGVAGSLAQFQGDYAAARSAQEESLAIHQRLGNRSGIAGALTSLGSTLAVQGETVRSREVREEALAHYRELGAMRQTAGLLSNLGSSARVSGDLTRAQALIEESLAIRRGLADNWGIATSLNNLAGVAWDRSDFDAAKRMGEESLALYRKVGEPGGIAYASGLLGNVACDMGELSTARARFKECLSVLVELGNRSGTCFALEGLANTYVTEQPERSARLWGGADELRRRMGFPRPAQEVIKHERRVSCARAAMGDAAFDRASRIGAADGLQTLCEYASNEAVPSGQ